MNINEILGKMTLEEKIAFCSGASFWETKTYPQHGIPPLFVCDGPHGLRKQTGAGDHLGLNASVKSTCFPTASAAAATWDVDLLRRMGKALGDEALREDVHVILGPGVNMKRNPLCGRNFEYYSEDPFLAGKLAAAWIQGVQSRSVGVSLKHFAVNNQEMKRMAADALVDKRALHEYYLAAFEIAVREARPMTVMSAYNKINGVYCSDNRRLLTDILRGEWGFDGVVMSDWGGTHDRVAGFTAGMDLEMPGSKGAFDQEVKAAMENGRLDEGLIDASVSRLLTLIERTARDGIAKPGGDIYDRHHTLAREIAAAGGVLLKNDGPILPLVAGAGVTVIGALAEKPRYQGTGSSLVSPTRLVNLLEGLTEYTPSVAYHAGYRLSDEADDALLQAAVSASASAETVILCVGLTEICESEGYDRETLRLPCNQLRLIEAVTSANPNVIAVLVGGAAIEMPWADGMQAILHMQLPGQAGGQAVADLLFGTVNPSGKLAETYPLRYEDVVCASYYDNPPKQADYRESTFVGYRYFDSAQKAVRYPFGFGLSYTTFVYSDIRVMPLGGYDYEVRFIIHNTGSVAGAEVAQVYVASETGGAFRPAQELKGFAKVHLQPGETKEVRVPLCERSFAIYGDRWFVEQGKYELRVGASSRDIRLTASLQLDGVVPQKTTCASWYYTPHGAPSKHDFATVYGKYPDFVPQTKGSFTLENSILEMKDSSFLCRIIYRSIERQVAKPFGGKPDYTNVQFKMLMSSATDNPLHAMRLFSPEFMTARFTQLLVDSANGRLLPGFWRFLRK